MDDLLLTTWHVRVALGEDYTYIKDHFDPLPEQREKTRDTAAEAFKGKPKACAICGEKIRLQSAHIQALAECGETTPENLIPLCSSTPGRKGCHRLYDTGCASQQEMFEARQHWMQTGPDPSLRSLMKKRLCLHRSQPPNSGATAGDEIQHFIDNGYYCLALKAIRKRLSGVSGAERFRYELKRIEVLRRRTAKDSLEKAACTWSKLQASGAIPQPLTSLFYYEGGYIEMLLGRHEAALPYCRRSREAITLEDGTPTPGMEGAWLASAGLEIQTTIALKGVHAPWADVMQLAEKARSLSEQAKDMDIHGRRWVDNWNWHTVRIELVRGRMDNCVAVLKEAEAYARRVTTLEKWDWLGLAIRRTISGAVMAAQASSACDAKRALRHLSRALVLQVGQNRKHPEMVRDLLFAIAACLRLLGRNDRAERVESVAKRTRDGSSWLYPYRAHEIRTDSAG
jgi:hypothetical protein